MECHQTTILALALTLFAGLAAPLTAQTVINSLEWLPVTSTTNISFNAMQQECGVGGLYEGWRHATPEETWAVCESFGYDDTQSAIANAPAVEALHNFFGWTAFRSQPSYTWMTLGFTAGGTRMDIYMAHDFTNYQGTVYEFPFDGLDFANPEIGHYLVQPVPEPAYAALALALAALMLARRRRS